MTVIAGIHAVREALRAHRPLDRVHIVHEASSRLREIVELCRRENVPLRHDTRQQLDRMAEGVPHQGVVAVSAAATYARLETVLENIEQPAMVVALDGIEDPHNLGAIIRTAHAAGAAAVLVPERRAAGITPAAAKAAAGALEYVPVARVTNLNRALEELKERGFWITGLDEHSGKSFLEVDMTGPTVLVFGAEGRGLHEQTRRHCDFRASIPVAGKIASLNVSVAAGIVLFEALRQRRAKKPSS